MRLSPLFASLVLLTASIAGPNLASATPNPQVGFAVSVRVGPPVLPVYAQPLCPGPGYVWIPGYWAYDDDDGYYWVPGTWVFPPEVGLLWTPGYWGFSNGFYVWNAGYWGPVVGFYGGINYGFGYPGTGFYGGYWRGGEYFYNRYVTNVNSTVVHNVYNTTVVNNNTAVNRVSFNGGPGGAQARPTAAETQAMQQRHVTMTSEQRQLQQSARNDRHLFASVNHGRPDVAATSHPAELSSRAGAARSRSETPNRPDKAAPRAPEQPSARPPMAPAPRPAPSRPKDRAPAHEPPAAVKPAPHAERPPAHQPAPAPAPRPAPSHPNERPQHTPPPVARPAPAHPQQQPPAHAPAPAPRPHPAPRPSHPPEHNAERPNP